jgi:uncharacterized metal-binding protein
MGGLKKARQSLTAHASKFILNVAAFIIALQFIAAHCHLRCAEIAVAVFVAEFHFGTSQFGIEQRLASTINHDATTNALVVL